MQCSSQREGARLCTAEEEEFTSFQPEEEEITSSSHIRLIRWTLPVSRLKVDDSYFCIMQSYIGRL